MHSVCLYNIPYLGYFLFLRLCSCLTFLFPIVCYHVIYCLLMIPYPHEDFYTADKENGPKSINDIKLINAGRILENNKTLAESRLPLSEVPGGVITMHVVVRPPIPDKNSGNIHISIRSLACWFDTYGHALE